MNTTTKIKIGTEEYLFIKEYQEKEEYRHSLNQLTTETFGFDFEGWYEQSFWTNRYRPYSLIHNNRVVANVSVNPLDFSLNEKIYHTLQIGTVMTASDYRKQGLSRVLFDIILAEYEGQYDLMYLYANATVCDFYPRFGFEKAQEFIYSMNSEKNSCYSFRKLNGTSVEDRQLLLRLVKEARPYSRYTLVDNPYLPMFYLTAPLADCIYFSEELDLAAVVEYEKDSILIHGLFGTKDYEPEKVISSLLDQPVRRVVLGYTPLDTSNYRCELLQEPDTTFFVKGVNFIGQGRLPVLSHA